MNYQLIQNLEIIIFYHKRLRQRPILLIMFLVIMGYLKNISIVHIKSFRMILMYMVNGVGVVSIL